MVQPLPSGQRGTYPAEGGECPASPHTTQRCCKKHSCLDTQDFTAHQGTLPPFQPVVASSMPGRGGRPWGQLHGTVQFQAGLVLLSR